MKSTIKITATEAVSFEPSGTGIKMTLAVMGVRVLERVLTLDQWGAISFGGDAAAEVAEQARMLAAAQARAA